MQIGIFIPIGKNGWLISTTAPQYSPSFELNRKVTQAAERYGVDFVLSMIKLRGFGGKSGFWDEALDSFSLMAALAAVTSRIQLYATVPTLAVPPAIAARMTATIDDVSQGRFGLNLITGWQKAEYSQMGLWPGEAHYLKRYDMLTEYITIMKELWRTGRCTLDGEYFTMDDCRLGPLPSREIPLVCAATSDPGIAFSAQHCDYNFCNGTPSANNPMAAKENVSRMYAVAEKTGSRLRALSNAMIIADETDELAMKKWEHYKVGTDLEAIDWRATQASKDQTGTVGSHSLLHANRDPLPYNGVRFIGSYATVARLLDEMATIPGLVGTMLTFDDFLVGIEQFGQRIQPLMKSRKGAATVAAE
jgi:pyrimidine oxygenase